LWRASPRDLAIQSAAVEARRHWNTRYAEGFTPWDTQLTPPEVQAFWQSDRLPAGNRPGQGMALDLGCGPGTNVRYLARLGFFVVGVEIAGAPLQTAVHRLQSERPDIQGRCLFVCADVCALPFQAPFAAYALDIGCLHSLPVAVRPSYAQGVSASLLPGGYCQIYAFDTKPEQIGLRQDSVFDESTSGPVGLAPGEVAQLFEPTLQLVEEVEARPDRRPCRWYLLQKRQDAD
jgi:SAM-dependent methyltransferase